MQRIIFIVVFFMSLSLNAQNVHDYVLKKETIETEGNLKLATDIYLQKENEKYPVILIRTPYSKDDVKNNAERLLKQGYAVVVQDCRGKFNSEGKFYAFKNERTDGLKTVSWIRKQSWCNGIVAGYGGSYNTYTQMVISDKLDAVTAELGSGWLYELLYPQGLFSLALACNWGLIVDSKTGNPISQEALLQSYWYLPLSIADDSTYNDNLFFNDWLQHEKFDKYWKSTSYRPKPNGPVLSIAGWYDIFLLAQLNDFIAIDKKQKTENNRIIIGPWCHGTQAFKNDYGGSSKTGQTGALQEKFLSKYLLGSEDEILSAPFTNNKYNLFIMERNEYFGSEQWPPKEVTKKTYYLDRFSITTKKPEKSDSLKFEYNPLNPLPNLGGTFLGDEVGPALQNKNNNRNDQIIFETEALNNPLILLGEITADLYVNITSPETDFIILAQDVFPNDSIINIQEGGKTIKNKSGKIKNIKLETWPTGYQLNPGHKLRIVITSSWFPRYNRNLNNGEPIYMAKKSTTTTNVVYYGAKFPSKVYLPILEIK